MGVIERRDACAKPLGEAADQLRLIFDTPVLGPIPSAVARLIDLIEQGATVPQAM